MSIVQRIKAALKIAPSKPELISIVLHFRHPAPLSEAQLHEAVRRAWGRDVSPDLNEHIVNKPPICFVKFSRMVLLLSSGSKPYCPPQYLEQALAQFPEERQKAVARDHKAFLTIDLLNPKRPTREEKERCYRQMGRLAAELVDDNCMGVYVPETGHMRPFDGELTAALRSDQPLKALRK